MLSAAVDKDAFRLPRPPELCAEGCYYIWSTPARNCRFIRALLCYISDLTVTKKAIKEGDQAFPLL